MREAGLRIDSVQVQQLRSQALIIPLMPILTTRSKFAGRFAGFHWLFY